MSLTIEQHDRRISLLARLCYAGLLIWPLYLIVSFFAFDAPGSEKQAITWLVVIPIWILPFLIVLAPYLARLALSRGWVARAYSVMAVPLTLLLAPMVLGFAGLAAEMMFPEM